ncbi:MAG: hypothetical protein ABFD60_17535 [Bryobacteraceae bacterium]
MRRLLPSVFAALILTSCSDRPSPAPSPEPVRAGEVKILQFYARNAETEVGTPVLLCYGVENARSVRIDPPVETLKPAYSRCFTASPGRDTTYTLIAEGPGGKTVRSSVTIKVKAKSSARREGEMIQLFSSSSTEVQPGGPVTLCYSVDGAEAVRIEPNVPELKNRRQGCVLVRPVETTTYTLTSGTSTGRTERRQLSVTVK